MRRDRHDIASRLEAFIGAHPGTPEAARARFLLAELHEATGEARQAIASWEAVVREGPGDDDRALALYLLGERDFLRGGSDAAGLRLRELVERFPGSRWAEPASRILRYIDLARAEQAPEFDAIFEHAGDQVPFGSEELRGQAVLLIFWKASSPGHRTFESQLLDSLSLAFQQYPVLQERVRVLGINLDVHRDVFDAAVREWRVHWPQVHDGLGFGTPLARLFHVPRAPHYAVIDDAGKLAYLGPDAADFSGAATRVIRDLRVRLENERTGER